MCQSVDVRRDTTHWNESDYRVEPAQTPWSTSNCRWRPVAPFSMFWRPLPD